MTEPGDIKPDMRVICSDGRELGIVDQMADANSIKLKKNAEGRHHYIPLNWVESVDDEVHCDRPAAEVRKAWSDHLPSTETSMTETTPPLPPA